MINTEKTTNNANSKLEFIKLDSKDKFISKNLDTAIHAVKEMLDNGSQLSQDEYLSCYMGLKVNGDFLLLDGISDDVSDIYDTKKNFAYLYATDVECFKKIKRYSETDCIKIAKKLLSDYYQHAFKLRNWQKTITNKRLSYFLSMEVEDIVLGGRTMMDCFFTPQAYIDYLLGQCQLPLTTDAKNILRTACVEYVALEPVYFYRQVFNIPNSNILIKDSDFLHLIKRVPNIFYYNKDLQVQKLLQLINKMLTKEGK